MRHRHSQGSCSIARPPVEVSGVLLHGEAVHLIFEQGQEAHLVDPLDQLLPALDAGGSSQSSPRMIHSPFSMAMIFPLDTSAMIIAQ